MAKKKRGRPMKYKSADALYEAIDGYFDSISYTETLKKKLPSGEEVVLRSDGGRELKVLVYVTPPGITAMCLAIGIDPSTWENYSNPEIHPEFSDVTRWAKARIEAYLEEQVNTRDRPQGVIFNLENNYGWKHKREVDVNSKVTGSIAQIGDISLDEKMRMIAEAAQEITAGGYVRGGDDGASEEDGSEEND